MADMAIVIVRRAAVLVGTIGPGGRGRTFAATSFAATAVIAPPFTATPFTATM
jgi:hypothetical protein